MTNLQNCLDTFSIYVGTYKKYNEGSIFGKWLKLSDYSDFEELQNAMHELHKDEEEPEFHFQDYECSQFFINQNLICEGYISREIYEIAEKIDNSNLDFETINAFIDCFGQFTDIDDLLEKVAENYYGSYDSDEDFAESFLQEIGAIPNNLPNYVYIDWERTARDLMFDFSSSGKHYFRNL